LAKVADAGRLCDHLQNCSCSRTSCLLHRRRKHAASARQAILEQIRNEIRQRRVPNAKQFQNQVDGQYNPESIQEDYYFPVTAAGRGSSVETLPGGGTWDTPELDHFMQKMFRALRVPTSYMRGSDANGAPGGGQYNDGKVGIAYIEELRFANFIKRLQVNLEEVFDKEFKTYLAVAGINIDNDIFSLKLPDPQNFALYQQAALGRRPNQCVQGYRRNSLHLQALHAEEILGLD
jgi:hypothetical protein